MLTSLSRSESFLDEANDGTREPFLHTVDESRKEFLRTRLTFRSVDVENIAHSPIVSNLSQSLVSLASFIHSREVGILELTSDIFINCKISIPIFKSVNFPNDSS